MDNPSKFLIAGGFGLAVLALGHRHRHGGHCSPSSGGRRHHHHHGAHIEGFGGAPWQGLTEDEARRKLAERLEDEAAIDAAIDELDTRGYLATS